MSDVLRICDMAQKLGMSEAALRAAVHRKKKDMPQPFKLCGKWAWRRVDVDKWLEDQTKNRK